MVIEESFLLRIYRRIKIEEYDEKRDDPSKLIK